jgi:hypothetical protein
MNKSTISAALAAALLATNVCVAQNTSRGVKRDKEECEQLAMQIATNPRASGSAVSQSEAIAQKMALVEARAELAAQVAAEVTGITRRRVEQYQATAGAGTAYTAQKGDLYVSVTGNDNSPKTVSAILASDSSETAQRVSQTIRNTRPICTNTYDQPDGSVQVYVCVEMGLQEQREVYKELKNNGLLSVDVDNDGKNDVDFAEKEFLLELAKAREDYNAKRNEEGD